ncbi:MAG: DUF4395 family protein [candidate division Zixibacteria bacterium]
MSNEMKISSWSKKRLEEQGFCGFTDTELRQHRFGIRLAYIVCLSLVVIGLVAKSQLFLLIANIIALIGILPPYHPIDYLYNFGLRHLMNRPKLPRRANQGRFACALATVMLAAINYYFYLGNFTVVYAVSAALLTSAFLVGFIDLCIPSIIYNALFGRRFN